MRLDGAKALVTGGAVRIGRAICEALAGHGCEVVIHCRTSRREARELARRIVAGGGRAHVVTGNLASPRICRRIVREAVRKAGGLNILVNNASMFHPGSSATNRFARDELRVNLVAPAILMREFTRGRRRGKIINMLDQRIARCEGRLTPYHASKVALAELTVTTALQLAPRVTVNGVAPGPVLPPPRGREKAGRIPMKRRPSPEDVAGAVVFLLENDSITGQIIFVDGGQHLLGVEFGTRSSSCPPQSWRGKR